MLAYARGEVAGAKERFGLDKEDIDSDTWSSGALKSSNLELNPWTATPDPKEGADITLGKIMDVLRQSRISGPFSLTECHRGATFLGAGSQFEVFGRRAYIEHGVSLNDKPSLLPVTFKRPVDGFNTVECVAVKRATFLTLQKADGSFHLSGGRSGHQVDIKQLQSTYTEILALCHPPLRQHPNIIRLLAWGYDRAAGNETHFSPLLITEHAIGSLRKLSEYAEIPWAIKSHLCLGIGQGVQALHDCVIIHGDIKPDNILVFANPAARYSCTAKIADFGLSLQEDSDSRSLHFGTPGWAAPELLDSSSLERSRLPKCDVWSLGLTIWSIMTERGKVVEYNPQKSCIGQLLIRCQRANMSARLQRRICEPLQRMLQLDHAARSPNSFAINKVLEQDDEILSEEEKQASV